MKLELPASLIEKLRNGQVSSYELTLEYINSNAEYAGLNALCFDHYEQALQDAQRCDSSIKDPSSNKGLHGLPVTIKECFDLVGTPSTFGVTHRISDVPVNNDIYVDALKKAGAVILGKSNVSQLLAFIECNNPVYGMTKNPFNPDFSCGGSSGGEGALVGSGLSPLGLGTDIGGSIRVPAAVNGACSIKPTAKRIKDVTRFSDAYGTIPIKSTCGAISQDAQTLNAALTAMNDAAREHWPVEPLLDYRQIDVSHLKIGYYTNDGIFPVSAPIEKAVFQTVSMLKSLGAQVTEFRFPDLDVAEALFYQGMSIGNGHILFDALGEDKPVEQLKMLHSIAPLPSILKKGIAGLLTLLGQRHESRILKYIGKTRIDLVTRLEHKILEYSEAVLTSMQNATLGELDAVISPVLPVPAYLNHSFEKMGLGGTYCLVNNVTGFPSGVACTGRSDGTQNAKVFSRLDAGERRALQCTLQSKGMPVSVQITAQPWREDIVLALIDKLHQPFLCGIDRSYKTLCKPPLK